MPHEFIVAEVSKNWQGHHGTYVPYTDGPLISNLFEQIIEVNRQRGYELHTFQFHRFMLAPDEMNESIIAVFKRTVIDG